MTGFSNTFIIGKKFMVTEKDYWEGNMTQEEFEEIEDLEAKYYESNDE